MYSYMYELNMKALCFQDLAISFLIASFLFVSIIARQSRLEAGSLPGGQTCPADDVLFVKEDVSTITCSAICSVISTCVGVAYTPETNLCVGCRILLYTTNEPETYASSYWNERRQAAVEPDTKFLYNCGEINGWEFFNGSYYKHYQHINMAFEGAQNFCQTQCSYMVHIDSMEEAQYIKDIARNNQGLYIGLQYDSEISDWKWTDDNEQLTMSSNWGRGEPNGFGSENCVSLFPTSYDWVDVDCLRREFSFVCEKKGLANSFNLILH